MMSIPSVPLKTLVILPEWVLALASATQECVLHPQHHHQPQPDDSFLLTEFVIPSLRTFYEMHTHLWQLFF